MKRLKILLLEDDMLLSEIIEEFLLSLGYEVTLTLDGEEAQNIALSEKFDLFILDVNVPFLNGFEFLKSFRDLHDNTPAIFITSLNTPADMHKGFEVGGDDYIKKPFDLSELELRIENIKKHFKLNLDDATTLIDNNIFFNKATLSIINDGKQTTLPPKEASILTYLIDNSNRVISLEELAVNIWDYDHIPSDSTIRTYIKNLRKVIGEEKIINLKGVGYRFNKK